MIQKFFAKIELLILSIVVLVGASIFFYIKFENFKPKESVDLNKITGNRIASNKSIPKPKDAEILGVSKSENATQTTFETNKKPQEIHDFYKNILENDGWELDLQEKVDSFFKTKFVKENESITITASQQENSERTVVSANQMKN